MDLTNYSYDEVNTFLELNLSGKVVCKPCVNIEFDPTHADIYELIIISNDEYFDNPSNTTITYGDCYYYILQFNNEEFYNELSVLDCGGYYIAICIFKNKINITSQILYNKENEDEYYIKYHMNTFIGKRDEIYKFRKV